MKQTRRSPWRILYKFHRYAGLSAGIILIMLSITGIFLNHTGDLQLDKQFVSSPAILDWYGISSPEIQSAFPIPQHWISQAGQQVYLDSQVIFTSAVIMVGAVSTPEYIAIAFHDFILLVTHAGELIEKVDQQNIEKIALIDTDNIYVQRLGQVYYSDDALMSWQMSESSSLKWSSDELLTPAIQQRLQAAITPSILPYERVMLDIHSGRFFGTYGVFIVDLAGVLFMLLAISGTWIWLKHSLKHWGGRRSKK
ncbi:MAG: hypothetical protein GQ581_02365 [Methyloprofundus sp.]|nr:hypothetical protein [Methyloprofundus sp.]